jgi:hypothetical protein
MSDEDGIKLILLVFSWILGFLITGVYYLSIANTWSHKWDNAILYAGSVHTEHSDGGSNNYYAEQHFLKFENSSYSCTVRRPTIYTYKGDANAFISRMKLGTTRIIFQQELSAGTCFDGNLRNHWNILGGIFLGISMIPFIIVGIALISTFFNKSKPPRVVELQITEV